MQYEQRLNRDQGNYIVASGRDFEDILIKEPVSLITGDIYPGQLTDLHGWFNRPVKYCGILPSENVDIKYAIFFIGEGDCDLFSSGGCYYDMTYILKPDRIGKSYKEGTFRDCYLRKKNNKHFWK